MKDLDNPQVGRDFSLTTPKTKYMKEEVDKLNAIIIYNFFSLRHWQKNEKSYRLREKVSLIKSCYLTCRDCENSLRRKQLDLKADQRLQ